MAPAAPFLSGGLLELNPTSKKASDILLGKTVWIPLYFFLLHV
jgi:hypothetical protein